MKIGEWKNATSKNKGQSVISKYHRQLRFDFTSLDTASSTDKVTYGYGEREAGNEKGRNFKLAKVGSLARVKSLDSEEDSEKEMDEENV